MMILSTDNSDDDKPDRIMDEMGDKPTVHCPSQCIRHQIWNLGLLSGTCFQAPTMSTECQKQDFLMSYTTQYTKFISLL
jgi:hypothetical protein